MRERWPKARTMTKAASDLPNTMMADGGDHRPPELSTRLIGSNSMPTETKNSTAKASRSGSVSFAACWLSGLSLRIMPAKKAPSAKRDAEQLGRAEGDAERDGEHAEAEQFARAGVRDIVQHPRDEPAADDQHERDEGDDLASSVDARECRGISCRLTGGRRGAIGASSPAAEGRKSNQRQHHHEILDDQPADGDAPLLGLTRRRSCRARSSTTVLATDRARPKTIPAPERPAEQMGEADAEQRREGDLHDGAGNGDGAHREQVLDSEKCRPTPNISRMTPISASSWQGSGRRRSRA